MRKALAIGVLAWCVWTTVASAQAAGATSWRWSAHLSVSPLVIDSDWTVSHPFYGGGGVTWETFAGTFTQRALLQGGLELRRRNFGFRLSLGVLHQNFTQITPAQNKDLRLLLGGLTGILYPAAGWSERLEPYLAVGAGGQKATGDMDNTGFYISGAAGMLIGLTSRVALDAGVQIHRLNYTQIELTPDIAKDVPIYPVSVFFGTRIGG